MEKDYSKPSEAFLRTIDVHDILPQEEPFVMIGKLVKFDNRHIVTETEIKEENIFVDEGLMSVSGLIENIAQTCAARIGYANKFIFKKGIQIGFIGAIRNLEVLSLPRVGEKIITQVDILEDVMGMTLANASVYVDERLLIETEMKIAVKAETE